MLFIQLFLTNRPAGKNLSATPRLQDFLAPASYTLLFSIFLSGFFFFLLFKAYQDNIISNLTHITKWDHILLFSSKKTTDAARPRHYQCCNTACLLIKLHIPYVA